LPVMVLKSVVDDGLGEAALLVFVHNNDLSPVRGNLGR